MGQQHVDNFHVPYATHTSMRPEPGLVTGSCTVVRSHVQGSGAQDVGQLRVTAELEQKLHAPRCKDCAMLHKLRYRSASNEVRAWLKVWLDGAQRRLKAVAQGCCSRRLPCKTDPDDGSALESLWFKAHDGCY